MHDVWQHAQLRRGNVRKKLEVTTEVLIFTKDPKIHVNILILGAYIYEVRKFLTQALK